MDISVYDRSFLEKTINNRITETLSSYSDNYFELLINNPDESNCLYRDLGNSYSEFFRNPLTFALLEQAVIPKIYDRALNKQTDEIRIWSAGCASGQEPYSLAMLCDDYKNVHHCDTPQRIFATDCLEDELLNARKGVYDFKVLKEIKLEFAEKYFSLKAENYVLESRLKELVDFSLYDLLDQNSSSPPAAIYGDFDLIMCSNVLFYYAPEYQEMILKKFYRSLKPGGFFIAGEAETHTVNSFGKFRPYFAPAAIFIK